MPKTKTIRSGKTVSRFLSKSNIKLGPTVAAVALVVAVGGYALVQHASASGFPICLKDAPAECLTSNGPGNSVRLRQIPNRSLWTEVDKPGTSYRMYENGAHNCLRHINEFVTVSSGVCYGAASEQWKTSTNSDGRVFVRTAQSTSTNPVDLTANGKTDGAQVEALTYPQPLKGFYAGWNF